MGKGPQLGKRIGDGDCGRDAVHVAVAAVTAEVRLSPGQHIGFTHADHTELVGPTDHNIGIVDPFITGDIEPGQRFWMFLYPDTITGLRHIWTHPAFGTVAAVRREKPAMIEREVFLRDIAADEKNTALRLVYADWLDDHGEHEEAERQRKWPKARDRLDAICREVNAHRSCRSSEGVFTCDQLIDFGRRVSEVSDAEIVFSIEEDGGFPDDRIIIKAIRDQIPEFWRAWSIVTGLPLNSQLERKSYVEAEWACCPNEVYPERHLAGPKPERFLRAEAEEARARRAEKLEQRLNWEEQFDAIQDKLEDDSP